MKPTPPSRCTGLIAFPSQFRNPQSEIRICFLLLIAAMAMIPMVSLAAAPTWWTTYGVLTGGTANDYAAANQGQAKWTAVQAVSELDNDIPQFGGAGSALDNLAATLLSGTATASDFSAINLGQLKALSQPFFDHLMSLGYYGPPLVVTGTSPVITGTYPWIGSGKVAADFAMSDIGQVKQMFCFDVTFSSAGVGIPDWWVEKYFPGSTLDGNPWVDPNGLVAWSGTVTNLQAYQQGLMPTDFYNETLPVFTVLSGTSLGGEPGSISVMTVLVTSQSGIPLPGAPVTFSIDSGLLLAPGASVPSQTVQVYADANGIATVLVITSLLPGTNATVTAQGQTVGQTTSVQAKGSTTAFNPTPPDRPPVYAPTPVNKPTLSETTTSISVENPTFEQFDPPANPTPGPVQWFSLSTETQSGASFTTPSSVTYSGQVVTVGTANPLFGVPTYSGTFNGTSDDGDYSSISTATLPPSTVAPLWDALWTGTASDYTNLILTSTFAIDQPLFGPAMPPGDLHQISIGPTQLIKSGTAAPPEWTVTYTDETDLSEQYTDQQFTQDALNAMASSTLSTTTSGTGYALGGPIAWYRLAADSSSLAIATGTYSFNCASTGTAPYVFEWYEVFQPDDPTQPMQLTHQHWDNANQQAQSPPYTINPSTTSTNGTWFIARLDTHTATDCPECQWRHDIGVGEQVDVRLVGLPASISGSAVWSVSPITSGSFLVNHAKYENVFFAARAPGNITISATFPANTECSTSGSFSTTFTVYAPTGVIIKKIAPISMPSGNVGAGMWCQYSFLPTNVSFSGCVYEERKCGADAVSGWRFQLMNLLGELEHNPNGSGDINADNWISIQNDNTGLGLDQATIGPYSPTYVGGFTWNIPVMYKCVNDIDEGVLLPGNPVTQTMSLSSSGTGTVKKAQAPNNGAQQVSP